MSGVLGKLGAGTGSSVERFVIFLFLPCGVISCDSIRRTSEHTPTRCTLSRSPNSTDRKIQLLSCSKGSGTSPRAKMLDQVPFGRAKLQYLHVSIISYFRNLLLSVLLCGLDLRLLSLMLLVAARLLRHCKCKTPSSLRRSALQSNVEAKTKP